MPQRAHPPLLLPSPEVERFNQTLRTEWEVPEEAAVVALNESLVEWLVTYNSGKRSGGYFVQDR